MRAAEPYTVCQSLPCLVCFYHPEPVVSPRAERGAGGSVPQCCGMHTARSWGGNGQCSRHVANLHSTLTPCGQAFSVVKLHVWWVFVFCLFVFPLGDVRLNFCTRTGSRAEASCVFCLACLFSIFLTGVIFLHGTQESYFLLHL